ncbi:AraC family transcriptional regulator [Xylophilus sp.]|uniref:AraC family transcriptional regulator n=1 Tax=Xylophilus sp. TaxID=2653893 RepID=UPI0013B71E65|nr:helix-turn-helix transcriptional regulator [Xylophilus sp.]KAF1043246.1 MAG: HTH-type transcriptional regulator NimR [Xylophilus sp.]
MTATPFHPARPASTVAPLGDSGPFTPSRERPVRVRARRMQDDTHFEPHRHAWAQLAYCATGILQVTVEGPRRSTYIVPPSRSVWIAPGAVHAVAALEEADLRTLYIDAVAVPAGWDGCRVIVLSALLRELIPALETADGARECWLTALVLDELARADTHALGVPLPDAEHGDKRLRSLCDAVLRDLGATGRTPLAGWAAAVGASERTMARLFRDELGMSYQQWRQQAVLARALPMLAQGVPVQEVAAASGYASESAFSAMFKAAMGQPPKAYR